MYKDCGISIDKVKALGDYIEIEYKGESDNVEKIRSVLNAVLKEISAEVGPADHKGYAYNILRKNNQLLNYEKSCGAIVFHKFVDEYKILIINFIHGNCSYLGFPKGHVEKNETEIQTAEREIREETGLNVTIIPEFRTSAKFSYKKDTINEAVYFAAESVDMEIRPQDGEEKEIVVNSKWCDFDEAENLLTFDCDKDILNEFVSFFNSNKF